MSLRAIQASGVTRPKKDEVIDQPVAHQFEDIDQQNECYIVGMWSFLVTEIMFFGALFLAYSVYRSLYPATYLDAHRFLDINYGTLNTFILLFSSLSMAMAIYGAQHGKKAPMMLWLIVTITLSFGFLGIKAIEYTSKIQEGLFPPSFNYAKANTMYLEHHGGKSEHEANKVYPYFPSVKELAQGYEQSSLYGSLNQPTDKIAQTSVGPFTSYQPHDGTSGKVEYWSRRAQLFFSIYFAMTGLHAVHIIIGIIMMTVILVLRLFDHPSVTLDYMPTEMVGMYWHFVDIVWIFLFPLMYLIS